MPGQGDVQTALSALAEGDATSSMIDVAMEGNGNATAIPPELFAKIVKKGLTGDATGNAPHVMTASLIAPYVDGTLFVNELRKLGGWSKVDEAWKTPPASTEQVLHLQKWVAHEAPLTVNAPTAAALGAGWTAGTPDTMGELVFRTILEEWMPEQRAVAIAANWGGDRAVLFHNGESSAFALHLRYDAAVPADSYAANAFAAIAPAIAKSPVKDNAFACIERFDRGPLAIMKKGVDIAIVAGPSKTPAKAAWSSAGDCTLAKKWASEVLK
jgi:hypothetical protein